MDSVKLRPAVRALILDPDDRLLLCRFVFPRRDGEKRDGEKVVWAAPGGGVEPGEAPLAALRRELWEEVGLTLEADPVHVWHQVVVAEGHAAGYDGVINDYYLVRSPAFTPRGALDDAALAAENVYGWRWWEPAALAAYDGSDLFSPRDLATPLSTLLATGPPKSPLHLGL